MVATNPSQHDISQNPYSKTNNKDWGNLATLNPEYYSFLTDPSSFDYSTAPTGTQAVHFGYGKNNDFNINWDQLLAPHNAEVAAKAASDKAAADAATAAAAKTAADTRATAVTNATTGATTAANNAISAQGLDPTAYSGSINDSIAKAIAAAGSGDLSTVDGSSIASNVLNSAQSAQRTKLGNQVSSTFGPNYGNNLISSNLLDNTISDIIGQQKGAAQTYLDAGKARGIYNDIGYNKGESIIGNDETSGTSQLQSLGQGVISKYRTNANNVASNAASAASGYTLGSNFNLGDYTKQGDQIASDASKYSAGDLRTALGGTNYFNLADIGQGAGQAQGATNLQDNDLAAALDYSRKRNAASRGLGTTGSF